jgi:hypothetical protein
MRRNFAPITRSRKAALEAIMRDRNFCVSTQICRAMAIAIEIFSAIEKKCSQRTKFSRNRHDSHAKNQMNSATVPVLRFLVR